MIVIVTLGSSKDGIEASMFHYTHVKDDRCDRLHYRVMDQISRHT